MESKKHVFTATEKKCFVDILKKYSNIIDNKETYVSTFKKNDAWDEITAEYNRSPHVVAQVSCKQLRRLRMNLKQRAKELRIKARANRLDTEGEPSTSNPEIDPDVSSKAPGSIASVDTGTDSDTITEEEEQESKIKVEVTTPEPSLLVETMLVEPQEFKEEEEQESKIKVEVTTREPSLLVETMLVEPQEFKEEEEQESKIKVEVTAPEPSLLVETMLVEPQEFKGNFVLPIASPTSTTPTIPSLPTPLPSFRSQTLATQRKKNTILEMEYQDWKKRAEEKHEIEMLILREQLKEAKAKAELAQLVVMKLQEDKIKKEQI